MVVTLAGLQNPGAEVSALLAVARVGQLRIYADARPQWLGGLAYRMYGPNGPRIKGLRS